MFVTSYRGVRRGNDLVLFEINRLILSRLTIGSKGRLRTCVPVQIKLTPPGT